MTVALPLLPSQRVARAILPASEQLEKDLRDAAEDITRELTQLAGRSGIGAEVRRDQLRRIRSELTRTLEEVWRSTNKITRENGSEVAHAAASAQQDVDRAMFQLAGQALPVDLAAAEQAYARSTVLNYFARGINDIPLSRRVYDSKALSRGWVDRAVNRVILRGGSWRELAGLVRGMIDPNTPGGVSYAAKRLARTELNNAFHTAQISLAEQNPWTEGMKWNLSKSHPKKDDCDSLAGKVFTPKKTPARPHPQCLCFLTMETISEEVFMRRLLNGNYQDASQNYLERSAA